MTKLTLEQQTQLAALTAQYKQAQTILDQWGAYKKQVTEAILALAEFDTEQVFAELHQKCKGSKTISLEAFHVQQALELSYDQEKIVEVLAGSPFLIGTVVKVKYEPESAARVLAYLKNETEVSTQLQDCLIEKRRGPYVSLKPTKEGVS